MQGKPDDATKRQAKRQALRSVKFALGLMINVGGMLAVAQTLLS